MSLQVIEHISNQRILFSPLNWGLGHVARSIPILQKLLEQGNHILVACDGDQHKVYIGYFPNLEFITREGYPFRFSANGNFALDLFRSIPKLISFAQSEVDFVEDLCQIKKIDLVVSDHRYFFRAKKTKSIFITHQITLPLPWHLKLAQVLHTKWLNKFDEIWILDNRKNQFAGKLSQGKTKINQVFLGPVSRFEKSISALKSGVLIVVSGPEPYAAQFYTDRKAKLKHGEKIVYQGKIETLDTIREISWKELDEEIVKTKLLVSRSGYSTIMDSHFLKCETEFYPTKGQWEQEYLFDLINNSQKNI
jgi:hypothetical protein